MATAAEKRGTAKIGESEERIRGRAGMPPGDFVTRRLALVQGLAVSALASLSC